MVLRKSPALLTGKRWRLAAPSFVMPGTVAENCRFLSGQVDEIALCIFQTEACLAYGENDLPAWLADLPGRTSRMLYHVHLPLDLPWNEGPEQAAAAAAKVARKAEFLTPRAYVLHPPKTAAELQAFFYAWRKHGFASERILLENIADNDLAETLRGAYGIDCGICLDFGHAMAYSHNELLESSRLLQRVRMLHVYTAETHAAPDGATHRHKHLPMDRMSREDLDRLDALIGRLAPYGTAAGRTLLLELFDWDAFQNSVPFVARWTETPSANGKNGEKKVSGKLAE